MRSCRICGERSSIFRSTHKECAEREARERSEARRAERKAAAEAGDRRKSVLQAEARSLVSRAFDGTLAAPPGGDSLPFNFLKSEALIAAEGGVGYHKYVAQRSHRTTGASIRVARGVWIRQNAGRSRPDDKLERVDTGVFAVTTKHVYFAGGSQRFRIRLDRLVTHEAWPDAFSVTRDRAAAQPEFFGVADPERTASLLTAIYERE